MLKGPAGILLNVKRPPMSTNAVWTGRTPEASSVTWHWNSQEKLALSNISRPEIDRCAAPCTKFELQTIRTDANRIADTLRNRITALLAWCLGQRLQLLFRRNSGTVA